MRLWQPGHVGCPFLPFCFSYSSTAASGWLFSLAGALAIGIDDHQFMGMLVLLAAR